MSQIEICDEQCEKISETIKTQILKYNSEHFNLPFDKCHTHNICRIIRDQKHNIIAGITAQLYIDSIYIKYLWVDPNYRKNKLGSLLLQNIQLFAINNKCSIIYLDTYDFQAKDFYLKNGFELFGNIRHFGHIKYYLSKYL